MRSFIFGEGQEAKTPAQLARMRELADAMVAANGRAPQNVGEGLQSIGNAILYRSLMGKVGAGEKAGQNRASAAFNNIAGALAGPKAFPAAPTGGTASAPQSADAQAIRSGLIERGLPEHVADGFLMNFQDESGMNPGINEKAPLVPGSRGGFGLYQLTGPRRTAYEAFAGQRGVDPSDTNAQLDFLMTELQGPEAKAAQSIMATKDAGSAASAIARDFLRPAKEHLDSRVARYMGGNPAPVQVASADPSDGIAQALAQQQSPQPQGNQQIAQALAQQQNQPQVQDLSQVPVMAGGTGGAITRDAQGGPSLQMLMETANEPFLNDSQRGILDALMQQQMKANDPATALERRKTELEIRNLENPNPEYGFQELPDGTVVRTDKRTGAVEEAYKGQPKAPEDPTNVREYKFYVDQEKAGGREPLPFNEWQLQSKRAGATVINNGSNTSEFVKKSDEAAAKRMDEIVTAGQTAPQTMADMQQLIDLGAQIGTGKEAQIKAFIGPYAQALGIDVGNMNEIQAYEAITSRLAPQMRAVGSGSSSDRDVSMFLQSLPNLRNLQGGNEIIANTMKAVSQNKINAAEIASKAQRGEISWQDADKQIRELPNPYELFKTFQKETETSNGGKVPEGMDPADWEFMTPEERRLFQ